MTEILDAFEGGVLLLNDSAVSGSFDRQFIDCIVASGLCPPCDIVFDGKIHKYDIEGDKKGRKSGWYIAHHSEPPIAQCGDFKSGQRITWKGEIGRPYTLIESRVHADFIEKAKKAAADAKSKRQEVTSNTANIIWAEAEPADPENEYLKSHKILPNGIRQSEDGRLIAPICSKDLEIRSLQYIGQDGDKKFHSGGEVEECFWWVGDISDRSAKKIYICEGYATACSIHEATDTICFVSYSAANLEKMACHVLAIMPEAELVVVADNDKHGVGEKSARKTVELFGGSVVMPPKINGEPTDACDYRNSGADLNELLNPKKQDWLDRASDICKQPSPIKWLIKNWIPRECLIMGHGPPGSGKSFVVLDMCFRISSSIDNWHGSKVRSGTVVYLAGEGHIGIRARLTGLRQTHGVDPTNLWVSKSGCDLDTPAGLSKAVKSISTLEEEPCMIVVDTLHRFYSGDENSSQDAKKMITACSYMQERFSCSVLLVHHTGVSKDATQRARGSSAWRGALDSEFSIEGGNITQMKQKDVEEAEPVSFDLVSVPLDGWIDEDGDQVCTAVPMPAEPKKSVPSKVAKKESEFIGIIERAWAYGGQERRDEMPYITKSSLREMLTNDGWTNTQVKNSLRADEGSRMIGSLINSEMIKAKEHGWIVVDPAHATCFEINA